MECTKVQRAFAVEAYFRNGRSIIATQRAFRAHFNIAPRVPGRQSIVSWVNNFRKTGDVKKKKPGLPRTVRTPQNIDLVRQSVLRSTRHSTQRDGCGSCVVPAGRCHSTHISCVSDCFAATVPMTPHLLERRSALASTVT
jgi:hypothetical protein